MIGFVTWPPFTYVVVQKGGQVTKPIMRGCEIAILLNYCVHVFEVKGFTINNYTVPKLLGLT